MSEGVVKCCGTPMFLKRTFGAGYHLRIAKNRDFNGQTVLHIIRNFMPNADIKSEINSEIIYSLEGEEHSTSDISNTNKLLVQLFTNLETRKDELNIETYGLTVTTMEDVFLRVGNESIDTFDDKFSKSSNSSLLNEPILVQSIRKNSGNKLGLQQFKALFLKRFHYAKRYWPMIVLQTVLPAILFMCILLLDSTMKSSFTDKDTKDLKLNLKMYGKTHGFIQSGIKDLNDIYIQVSKTQDMSTEIITGII